MNHRIVFLVVIAAIVSVSGCVAQNNSVHDDDGKIKVAVSILPLADFVEKIGGDNVEVTVMVPPLASPETYEPTPSQLKMLADARMIVKAGSGLIFEEDWMDTGGSSEVNAVVVDCSKGVEVVGRDPHIWMSLTNAKVMVKNVYDGLADADPDNAEFYGDNYREYILEIEMLEKEIENRLDGGDGKSFLILHPAFGYFARDYELVQVPIEVEGKEPSSADVSRLIGFARENGIRTIFVQPGVNYKNAEVIADEINGTIAFADPLAEDYIENMRSVSISFAESMR